MNTLSEILTAIFNQLRQISEGINTIIAGAQANNDLLKSIESRIISVENRQDEIKASLTMEIPNLSISEPNAAGAEEEIKEK